MHYPRKGAMEYPWPVARWLMRVHCSAPMSTGTVGAIQTLERQGDHIVTTPRVPRRGLLFSPAQVGAKFRKSAFRDRGSR